MVCSDHGFASWLLCGFGGLRAICKMEMLFARFLFLDGIFISSTNIGWACLALFILESFFQVDFKVF